jgi:TP901 family phage tail tape measure protein
MAQFDVDFTGSMRQLGEFNLRLKNVGDQLDNMEKAFGTTGSVSKEVFTKMRTSIESISTAAVKAGADSEKIGKALADAEGHVASLFQKMAAENVKATAAAAAYNGEMNALRTMLNDTASKNTYVQWQQKATTLTTKLAGENGYLRQQIGAMSTELGKSNANLKVNLTHKQNLATVEQRLRNTGDNLVLTLAGMTSGQGKSNVMTQAYINARRQQITEEFRLNDQLHTLERTLKSLEGGQQEQIAKIKQLISAKQAEITETGREITEIERLKREHASLNGGLQEEIARLRSLNTSRKQTITEVLREEAEIEKLKRQHASLNGGLQEEITKLKAIIAQRKAAIAETVKEKTVVDEQAKALAREQAVLLKLQQQMSLVSSARGLEITRLKQQISDQEKYNRILSMSTLQLLGFGRAQNKVSDSNIVGSQAAAMLRASLGGLQANIGMYTSGTILAAAATYALARALRSTVELGSEFTASMAKADAIMSTGLQSWMPSDMGAMEMQVRALGQSTMYTASEVALGLVELGQAGLSSADSIMALKPALNLAMIGGITMAQSADMATNVMMTFGMQAKDLTGIVDLMATAASQSNTNVEQLANALTYAGPAAHTAGISMKDTTAAIEALSNTGIKASRAGTGLRKLFVSLLNPTKKGQQMMDQYGISVRDMEGKTRSLTDILGQLNNALKGVGEGERLSAIQNLVGLYATSPVAALVGQAGDGGNLEHLRRQLEDTSGAAEEMRRKMENSLKFDWKQVISAFEEAQLQLFDAHEYQLRTATAKLSLYLIELTKPAKEIKDEYGNVTATFSELDLMLQHGKEAAEGLAYAMGGVMAFKMTGAAAAGLSAIAMDAKAAALNLKVLALGFADGSRGSLTMTGSLTAMRATLVSNAIAVRSLYTQVGLLGTMAVVGARGISMLATAASVLMRALGWVGIIYGIGSAIYAAFGQDSTAKILEQKAGVEGLKNEYTDLKKAIDATAAARERAAMVHQQDSELAKLGKINERRYQVEGAIDTYTNAGLAVPQSLKDELWDVEDAAARAGRAIQDAGAELAKMEDPGKKLRLVETDLDRARALAELETTAAAAKQAYDDAEGKMRLRQLDAWRAAQAAVDAFKGSLVVATEQSDIAAKQAGEAIGLMTRLRNEQMNTISAYSYEKTASNAQKLLSVQNEMVTVQEELDRAVKLGQGDVVERRNKELTGLMKKEFDLKQEVKGTAAAYTEAKEALEDFGKTDDQRLAKAKQALAELEASKGKVTYGSEALEQEAGLKIAQRELKIKQEIKQLESSLEKKANKDDRTKNKGASEEERELKAAQSAYDTLAKKFDSVSYAQRELEKGTKAMALLRSKGAITAEQQAKATGELNLQYAESVRALDLNAAAMNKVRESFNTSPFSQTASDLAVLNRNLEDGKVSLEEYARITTRISEKQKEDLKASLPQANLNVGNASDSPFTDWVSTELERAKGLEQFDKAMKKSKNEQVDAGAGIEDDFNRQLQALNDRKLIEQGMEQEHTRKLLEINKKYQTDKEGLIKTAGDAQAVITAEQTKYTEQMSTMALMAAMGSVSNVLGMFASAADDASTAQKIAFAAQKAITVAQILMYTHLAAAQAMTIPGDPMKVMGIPLATFITATGYANAGLVAGLAIGQLSGGGGNSTKSSGSGGTTMYDTGGYIPYNRTGIVGEYGPELVSGPVHVTGRGNSASKLNQGGGDSNPVYQITLAPVIQLPAGAGSGGAGESRQILDAVKMVTVDTLKDMIRPQGMLDNWLRSTKGT